ncbi:hypothetical protein A2W48_01455 [Candidatus Giovannonibacteria bacterium RIFCSPHIGHO2_12_44_12]|uniref:Methyltransferase domain-containing protein n=3 Tax=Candidatus Giovannoniibacteriota TaxID=1752738 RepID=A0A1F5WZZ9_9BACT|nr:MAG: hypothetical protein A2W48_01455 [Candidatus Giovannonibacteria bacterium RIFCSPHIGHO2_12_44_12]
MSMEMPNIVPEEIAKPKEQGEEPFPVSDIEDISERKLSSVALRLQELFPEQSERIGEIADSFLKSVHSELLEANDEIREKGLPELDKKSLDAIELFYQLKAEKQIRGCLPLEAKKAVYQYFKDIAGVIEKKEKTDKSIPELSNPVLKNTLFQKLDNGEMAARIPLNKEKTDVDFLIVSKNDIDQYCFYILSTLPKAELNKKQQAELDAYLEKNQESKSSINIKKLLSIVRVNPVLLDQFKSRFERDVANRERYTKRKVRETAGMLSVVFKDRNEGEKFLDLCTGTGDIATIIKTLGPQIKGVDLNKYYLKVGRIYDTILKKKFGSQENERHLSEADVINGELPDADVWIAKHPCAPHMALPDEIIRKFSENSTANQLYLLTCCANKSVGHCPHSYNQNGLISSEEWNQSCLASSDIGTEEEHGKIEKVQEALKKINNARIRYIRDVLHLDAELVEIPGTIMNQMIIVRK